MIFEVTPSQTVGPYFAIGLPFEGQQLIVPEDTPGAIQITGTVYDGHAEIVPDHVIEFWQPDHHGHFADLHAHGPQSTLPGFRGFGRSCEEDGDGIYRIVTIKPGPVPYLNTTQLQAPHIDVTVMARGMLNRVITRIYFADEPDANNNDPVLQHVPPDRRHTLLAQPTTNGYTHNIHLQGNNETVFFDL